MKIEGDKQKKENRLSKRNILCSQSNKCDVVTFVYLGKTLFLCVKNIKK